MTSNVVELNCGLLRSRNVASVKKMGVFLTFHTKISQSNCSCTARASQWNQKWGGGTNSKHAGRYLVALRRQKMRQTHPNMVPCMPASLARPICGSTHNWAESAPIKMTFLIGQRGLTDKPPAQWLCISHINGCCLRWFFWGLFVCLFWHDKHLISYIIGKIGKINQFHIQPLNTLES